MLIPRELRAPLAAQFVVFGLLLMIFGAGITRNANELRAAIYDSCVARTQIEANSNRLLDQLIDSAARSSTFSAPEKAERIAGWRAVRHSTEACVRL